MDENHDWGEGGAKLGNFDNFSEREQAVIDAIDGDLDKSNNLQKRLEVASRKSQLLGLGEDQETASRILQEDDISEQVPLDREQIKRIRNIKVKLARQKTDIFTTIFKNETGREVKFKKQGGKMSEKIYNDVIVEKEKKCFSSIKYFTGGDRSDKENWKIIICKNEKDVIKKTPPQQDLFLSSLKG